MKERSKTPDKADDSKLWSGYQMVKKYKGKIEESFDEAEGLKISIWLPLS
jgi:hypothetical protein